MKTLFLEATGIKPRFFTEMKRHCQRINKMYHRHGMFGGALSLFYDLAVMLLFLGGVEISRSFVLFGTYLTFTPARITMITVGFLLLGIIFWMMLYHAALSLADMVNVFLAQA